MLKLKFVPLGLFVLLNFPAAQGAPGKAAPFSHNCRLLLTKSIGYSVHPAVMNSLFFDGRNSFNDQSKKNPHGWGLCRYGKDGSRLKCYRGKVRAIDDARYIPLIRKITNGHAHTVIAHVRNCSSGRCDIKDPHPFVRKVGSRKWTFIHNGTISVPNLLSLMGGRKKVRLKHKPPIDSEVFFSAIIEQMKKHQLKPDKAIQKVVQMLDPLSKKDMFNFIMTDGTTIAALRFAEVKPRYFTLFFRNQAGHFTVASEPVGYSGSWTLVPNYSLMMLERKLIRFIPMKKAHCLP